MILFKNRIVFPPSMVSIYIRKIQQNETLVIFSLISHRHWWVFRWQRAV